MAPRYEKTAARFAGLLHLAAAIDWLTRGQALIRSLVPDPSPASPPPPHPDAALLDLARQWSVIRQRWADLDQRDATLSVDEHKAQAKIISADERTIYSAAAALPATTAGGLTVRARLLATAADCEANDDAGIAAWAYEIAGVSMHLEQAGIAG